jgi:hypothetical protein
MKAGAVATGTIIAGAALIGAAQVGGLNPAQLFEPVQRDVALTTTATPDGLDLYDLLNNITINGPGGTTIDLGTATLDQVLQYGFPQLDPTLGQLFTDLGLNNPSATDPTDGISTTLNELLNVAGLGSTAPINEVLALLPVGPGDAPITGETDLSAILTNLDIDLPGSTTPIAIGDVTVDNLLALIPVPATDAVLSDATTLSTLLSDFPTLADIQLPDLSLLGGLVGFSGDLSDLVNDLGLGSDTLGQLLDFTSTTDLSTLATSAGLNDLTIDSLLAGLGTENGVTLAGTSTLDQIATFLGLGDQTLADLLPGGGSLTNDSTLVDLLNDTSLFGGIGSETIDTLLGLSATSPAEALAGLF